MELMVVVIIVAILAALAIPSMVKARDDRRAYDDAASVMQLFRQARMRSVGRGSAVAVEATSAVGTDRGTFLTFEAITTDPPPSTRTEYPFSSCLNANWVGAPSAGKTILVDGVNLNGQRDTDIAIQSTITVYTTSSNAVSIAWICFTPTGRVYVDTGNVNPTFTGATPFVDMQIQVSRPTGINRFVLVPPTGMARLLSR
jgi:type II secretory pathway pseudopilin PulG